MPGRTPRLTSPSPALCMAACQSRRHLPAFLPGGEQQRRPEPDRVLAVARAESRPRMLEGLRPYETQPAEPGRTEKIARPVAERSAEPGRRRDGEADFLPIDQLTWHAAIQRLPKDPLSPPVADLEAARKSPAELHQTVVEQGDPRLEADRHAGPVHLGQEVVWQVTALVREHHPPH